MLRRMRRSVLVLLGLSLTVRASAHPSESQALARLDAAIAAQPSARALHLERARALLRVGQPARALDAVRASGLASARALTVTARAYEALGRDAEARAALDRAIAHDPEHVEARWRRADLLERAARREAEGAAAPLESEEPRPRPPAPGLRAPDRAPEARRRALLELARDDLADLAARPRADPDVHLRLARVLTALDDPRAAQAALQDGLRRTGAVVLRRALVRAALDAGEPARALEAAVALIPASPIEGHLLRAEAEAALGRPEAAKATLRAALAMAEQAVKRRGSAASLARRAEVYLALGERARAEDDARAALARAPKLESAITILEALR